MALAGFGFEWAKAPVIVPLALIGVGWFFITVAIYQHNFFEGRSKYRRAVGNGFISGCVVILFAIVWFALVPEPQVAKEEQIVSVQERFVIASWHYFRQLAVWLYPYVVGAFVTLILFRLFVQPRTVRILKAYSWLHRLAEEQKKEIASHVQLQESFICDQKLTASVPSIAFTLPFINYSFF